MMIYERQVYTATQCSPYLPGLSNPDGCLSRKNTHRYDERKRPIRETFGTVYTRRPTPHHTAHCNIRLPAPFVIDSTHSLLPPSNNSFLPRLSSI